MSYKPVCANSKKGDTQAEVTGTTVLIGNSLVRETTDAVTQDGDSVTVVKQSGATFQDLATSLGNIRHPVASLHIVAGTREVDSDTPVDLVKRDAEDMIAKARDVSREMTISSVIPRTDKDVSERRNAINDMLTQTCRDSGVTFVDHDDAFFFRNGEIDRSSFVRDGVHLTRQGTAKLLKNLRLMHPTGGNQTRNPRAQQQRRDPGHDRRSHRPTQQHRRSSDNQYARTSYGRRRNNTSSTNQIRCWYCAEPGHTKEQCGHRQEVQCNTRHELGHKSKYCSYSYYSY